MKFSMRIIQEENIEYVPRKSHRSSFRLKPESVHRLRKSSTRPFSSHRLASSNSFALIKFEQ